jgi:hypothetical protein
MTLTSFAVHVSVNNENVVVLRIHAVPAAFGGGGSTVQTHYNTGASRFKVNSFRPVTLQM